MKYKIFLVFFVLGYGCFLSATEPFSDFPNFLALSEDSELEDFEDLFAEDNEGAQEDLVALAKKEKRMASNREHARKSRKRHKQLYNDFKDLTRASIQNLIAIVDLSKDCGLDRDQIRTYLEQIGVISLLQELINLKVLNLEDVHPLASHIEKSEKEMFRLVPSLKRQRVDLSQLSAIEKDIRRKTMNCEAAAASRTREADSLEAMKSFTRMVLAIFYELKPALSERL